MKKAIVVILMAAMITTSVTGCGNNNASQQNTTENAADTTSEQVNTETSEEEKGLKEAPVLAEQVKAGTLPAVEDRLPVAEDIMVEPDVISVGQYGGSVTFQANDSGRWNWGPWTEESMFRFKQDGSGEVEANVCKDFYANEDATEWTIELREGMKWSDGEPFTADDVIFYYDHCSVPALNEDRSAVAVDDEGYYNSFTSKPYNCYQVEVDGVKYWAEFNKVDDYKFTVTFAAPKPSFPVDVAVDNKWMFLPKHFYVNFISRKDGVTDDPTFPYITEEEAMANANAAFGKQWESYATMGKDIAYYNWDYAQVPQLRSFIAVKDNWDKVGETYELVRNPYFFKTDSEGNQLPYLDSLKVMIVNEDEQVVLKQASGELDILSPTNENLAVVADALTSTHTISNWYGVQWANYALALNQTVKNLDKRTLFQDVRFRQALSISVDRDLMNATLENGISAPTQACVPEGVNGYDEEWAKKWTEYDVEQANTILDELTEPWDGKEGTYRKMKGTNKDLEIVISIEDASVEGDVVSLLTTFYKAVGIKISDKVDAELTKTKLNNDAEASFEIPSVSTPAIRPDDIVPMRNFKCWYGAYGKWYEDGKSEANGGIEPTGDIMELINAYEAIKNAAGADREQIINENVQKIYDLHKENTWIIGFLEQKPIRWFVNNNVKNFPNDCVWVDEFRFASMIRAEQLYVEQ